jgi:hypothetical protein
MGAACVADARDQLISNRCETAEAYAVSVSVQAVGR